jgi:hypothetical protein
MSSSCFPALLQRNELKLRGGALSQRNALKLWGGALSQRNALKLWGGALSQRNALKLWGGALLQRNELLRKRVRTWRRFVPMPFAADDRVRCLFVYLVSVYFGITVYSCRDYGIFVSR